MCGRFTQTQSADTLAETFHMTNVPTLKPRYNIAPTQAVITIISNPQRLERQFQWLRWGLIPSWAQDPAIGSRLINARSETVAEKPSFRAAFRRRRCLVIADGFYEWHRQGQLKQPYYFHLHDHQPFVFAGLWERWHRPEGDILTTCTILTTTANTCLQAIHTRMPVILHPQDYDTWLNPNRQEPGALQPLLRPYPADAMVDYPVSTVVNRVANDNPTCLERLD